MSDEWRDDQPIYRQLQQKVSGLILDATYPEGTAVPSVRQVSKDLSINHLTVAKAYQELVDLGLLEKRRGLGMFVVEGARAALRQQEQDKFISVELPAFVSRLQQLDISLDDAMSAIEKATQTQAKEKAK
ncbi:MAG: GntR family transcriptional regulator [Cellvibrionaceae bacterium]